MTTTVVKTIGTGGDYTTLQAWEDASPANLVTSDQIWQGQCFNQEFFSSSAGLLNVSGSTVDSTRYKELTTYTGASFADNASVQTNALRYNASNGAGIRCTYAWSPAISCSESYFHISKLQIAAGTNVAFNGSASTGLVMDKCIVENSAPSNEPLKTYGSGTIKNSLIVQRSTAYCARLDNGTSAYNCTFVRLGSSTSNIFAGNYSTSTLKNCAFFGGATTLASGSTTKTYTTCYTDTSSPPSGCTTVAFNTTTGSGFENIGDATRDLRIKSTSAMIDVGTTDTTNAANDIAGTARPSGSAYDVGAWEYVSASGVGNASGTFSSITLSPYTATGAGSASVSVTFDSVTITPPTATAAGGSSGNASGSFDPISVGEATATATGSASVSVTFEPITIVPATAVASAGASGNAFGSFEPVTIGEATATATGAANAFGVYANITLSPATASASGGAGAAVWPSPATVLVGIYYGPTGTDYVGTLDFPTALEIADAVAAHVKTLTVGKFLALKD